MAGRSREPSGRAVPARKDVVLRLAHCCYATASNAASINGSQCAPTPDPRCGLFHVPLQVRVQKSRRVQADLFMSLHADAFYTPTPKSQRVCPQRRRRLQQRGALDGAMKTRRT